MRKLLIGSGVLLYRYPSCTAIFQRKVGHVVRRQCIFLSAWRQYHRFLSCRFLQPFPACQSVNAENISASFALFDLKFEIPYAAIVQHLKCMIELQKAICSASGHFQTSVPVIILILVVIRSALICLDEYIRQIVVIKSQNPFCMRLQIKMALLRSRFLRNAHPRALIQRMGGVRSFIHQVTFQSSSVSVFQRPACIGNTSVFSLSSIYIYICN